ncbi:hypothetical protein COLO4_28819 [Corchorus olitorius]|uniref:Uncharacterized protein n=1 Tax=Corchorus olitorius TaxID=93759 RepID=A0A1R3HI95_9ROSI|nr:hypothetical protein COLO4_28819 [Corchorus olitorius]
MSGSRGTANNVRKSYSEELEEEKGDSNKPINTQG